jgi:hypothetical protein
VNTEVLVLDNLFTDCFKMGTNRIGDMTYQDANLLVCLLARDAVGGELHQDGLGCHWGMSACVGKRNLMVGLLKGSS